MTLWASITCNMVHCVQRVNSPTNHKYSAYHTNSPCMQSPSYPCQTSSTHIYLSSVPSCQSSPEPLVSYRGQHNDDCLVPMWLIKYLSELASCSTWSSIFAVVNRILSTLERNHISLAASFFLLYSVLNIHSNTVALFGGNGFHPRLADSYQLPSQSTRSLMSKPVLCLLIASINTS